MWSDGLSHPRSPQACGVSGGAAARGGEGCWLLISPEVFASRSVLMPLSQFSTIGSKPAEQSLPPAPRESALRGAKAAKPAPPRDCTGLHLRWRLEIQQTRAVFLAQPEHSAVVSGPLSGAP